MPTFFYLTSAGVKIMPHFDVSRAQLNKQEELD